MAVRYSSEPLTRRTNSGASVPSRARMSSGLSGGLLVPFDWRMSTSTTATGSSHQ